MSQHLKSGCSSMYNRPTTAGENITWTDRANNLLKIWLTSKRLRLVYWIKICFGRLVILLAYFLKNCKGKNKAEINYYHSNKTIWSLRSKERDRSTTFQVEWQKMREGDTRTLLRRSQKGSRRTKGRLVHSKGKTSISTQSLHSAYWGAYKGLRSWKARFSICSRKWKKCTMKWQK